MELEIILKILLSALLGGIIGLQRELSHKHAGLKVNVLMAVGSTLLTVLAFKLAAGTKIPNPLPMAGHIISALGFIGAAIIVQARFALHGLTAAATVWCVGAIGMTVGSGYYLTAFLVTIFIVAGLTLLTRVSNALEKQGNIYAYIIASEERASIIVEIKKIVTDLGIKYISSTIKKAGDGFEIEIALNTSKNKNKEFIERVMQLAGVNQITNESL